MKKTLLLLACAGTLIFSSCNKASEENNSDAATTDTVDQDETPTIGSEDTLGTVEGTKVTTRPYGTTTGGTTTGTTSGTTGGTDTAGRK